MKNLKNGFKDTVASQIGKDSFFYNVLLVSLHLRKSIGKANQFPSVFENFRGINLSFIWVLNPLFKDESLYIVKCALF